MASGSVLTHSIACVVQQNVGKSMSSSKFVFNLDGMNEGENFSKDLLKVRLSQIPCRNKVTSLLVKMI